jgi:thiosulfate dehydrogenase (quinone) large subunit
MARVTEPVRNAPRVPANPPAQPAHPASPASPPGRTQTLRERLRTESIPAWVLLPLRLFMGVTFLYAGIQKLTDPQFFRASAPGYIGKQLIAFAAGSPIRAFLIHVAVPNARFFGALVACGELAIGLAILAGLLFRPAAIMGALLNAIFFLSATWRVRPYFYGADIVFIFAWLTLILAGPERGWLPALDTHLASWLLARVSRARRPTVARILHAALGVELAGPMPPVTVAATTPSVRCPAGPAQGRPVAQGRYAARQRQIARRDFLWGIVAGGAGVIGLGWLWGLLHPADQTVSPPAPQPTTAPSSSGGTPGTSSAIAQVSSVPTNSAVRFTIPSNGDPGVLVHTGGGQFVAFDATCTHAGCPVQFDPSSQYLLCPCHGAAFDPAHGAAVVQGPADTPLTSVAITVNNTTGAITLNG